MGPLVRSRGMVMEARPDHDGVAVRADNFSVILHIAGRAKDKEGCLT